MAENCPTCDKREWAGEEGDTGQQQEEGEPRGYEGETHEDAG